MSRAPDSLDPGVGFSTEAMEADWLAYTPLLTYAHAHGVTGTRLIPGLATDLPTITDGGTTYRFTLRKGLVYSNGQPVKASDFGLTVERSIRLGWPGSRRFLIGRIEGAAGFADRRAKSISGIAADDSTGQITIRLTAADGEFDDVLALPALAPIPGSTPVRDERSSPPPGVGPYRIVNVTPGRSFELVRNASWGRMNIPGIPAGHLGIDVRISPDRTANVLAVLGDKADVLDADNAIPSRLLGRVDARASGRFVTQTANATYSIFLDATHGPFSSQLAREAVVTGLDENVIERLVSGGLAPGCYLLPPAMVGHPSAPCPYREPVGGGNIARARALVRQSGWSGAALTVSRAAAPPLSAVTSYYVSLLDQIGFRASQAAANPGLHPQTGFALLSPALPDPAAIYEQLSVADDPFIKQQLRLLAAVPAGQLSAVSSLWMALDEYTARKAYLAVLGYPTVPELFSSRIDTGAVIFQPVVGLDWSSFALR